MIIPTNAPEPPHPDFLRPHNRDLTPQLRELMYVYWQAWLDGPDGPFVDFEFFLNEVFQGGETVDRTEVQFAPSAHDEDWANYLAEHLWLFAQDSEADIRKRKSSRQVPPFGVWVNLLIGENNARAVVVTVNRMFTEEDNLNEAAKYYDELAQSYRTENEGDGIEEDVSSEVTGPCAEEVFAIGLTRLHMHMDKVRQACIYIGGLK